MLAVQDTDFTPALIAQKRFTTALYFGPGLEAVVRALSGNHAEKIVAFTTYTAKNALLHPKIDEFSQSDIHQALLSTDASNTALQEFNINDYASLRPATGLRQFFPGLCETKQSHVDTISPQQALENAALEGTNNLLILGAMGFEMEALNAFLAADGPHFFSRIILLLPTTALYSSGSNGEMLAERLEQASYRCIWSDTSDPDMPIAAFDLDHARLNDRALLKEKDQEISAMNGRLEAQDQERVKLLKELEQAVERQKGSAAELENQQKLFADLRAEYDTSCAQISGLENTLDSVRKEKDHKISAMNGRLEAQDHERAKFLEELEQAAERQKGSAAELENQQKLFTDLRAEYDTSCAQISELENTLDSVRKEKEAASHELLQAWAKSTELEELVATLRAEHSDAQKQALEKIEEIEKIK